MMRRIASSSNSDSDKACEILLSIISKSSSRGPIESKSTISDLNREIVKLVEELEKQSNKGLFNRFK